MPVLHHVYQMTGTGEISLLFNSGVVDINRMFIVATNDGIDTLANSSQRLGDGTFKVFPLFLKYIQFMPWSIMKSFLLF